MELSDERDFTRLMCEIIFLPLDSVVGELKGSINMECSSETNRIFHRSPRIL